VLLWISCCPSMCPCGLLALTCRKHLTELNGRNCGLPWPNMESLNAWFGWCNAFIIINMTVFNVERRWVRILKSRQAWDKDAFWVLDFLLPFSQWAIQEKKGNVEHEGVGIDFGGFKCAETLCFLRRRLKNAYSSWVCSWMKLLKLAWC
jgi:hypothetical protein